MANGIDHNDIEVLSIGTGNTLLPLSSAGIEVDPRYDFLVKERENSNLFNDIKKQATTILNEPPDVASYMAHVA